MITIRFKCDCGKSDTRRVEDCLTSHPTAEEWEECSVCQAAEIDQCRECEEDGLDATGFEMWPDHEFPPPGMTNE